MATWSPVRTDYEILKDQLNRITPLLQRMQDDPAFLEKERHRHDNRKMQSTADNTRLDTPRTLSPERPYDEPLSTYEIYRIMVHTASQNPLSRYIKETRQEEDRIWREGSKRDEKYNLTYHGPDLIGRAGALRLRVMIRHSIKKRWECIGVWNPEWNTMSAPESTALPLPRAWSFERKGPRKKRKYDQLPFREQYNSWPAQNEESYYERAVRTHLEIEGSWNEDFQFVSSGTDQSPDLGDDQSVLITSRPWYVWEIEVKEENERVERNRKVLSERWQPLSEENVRARWKEKGLWKESWGDTPGWKWRHESPSPEPPDPNDMDFTPSEIDALEAIPSKKQPLAEPTLSPQCNFQLFSDIFKLFSSHGASRGEEDSVMDTFADNEEIMPLHAGSRRDDAVNDPPASNVSFTGPRGGARRTPQADLPASSRRGRKHPDRDAGMIGQQTEDTARPSEQSSGISKSTPALRRSARIAERKKISDAASVAAEFVKPPHGWGGAAMPRAPPSSPPPPHEQQQQQKQWTATRASTRRKGPSEKETAEAHKTAAEATTRKKVSPRGKGALSPQGVAKRKGRPRGKK